MSFVVRHRALLMASTLLTGVLAVALFWHLLVGTALTPAFASGLLATAGLGGVIISSVMMLGHPGAPGGTRRSEVQRREYSLFYATNRLSWWWLAIGLLGLVTSRV